MRLTNEKGQGIYFNEVNKAGKTLYIIKALSGQSIPDRDRKPHKSRSFAKLDQAERWLKRNGYR